MRAVTILIFSCLPEFDLSRLQCDRLRKSQPTAARCLRPNSNSHNHKLPKLHSLPLSSSFIVRIIFLLPRRVSQKRLLGLPLLFLLDKLMSLDKENEALWTRAYLPAVEREGAQLGMASAS